MPELSPEQEALAGTLVALRDLHDSYETVLTRFDALIEQADPGFDPDPVAEFDERSIAMEHLGSIRRAIDELARLLAATKGRHVLGVLVSEFESAEAERQRVARDEPVLCVRCGVVLATPQAGGSFSLDSRGAYCPDEVACGYRAGRRPVPRS